MNAVHCLTSNLILTLSVLSWAAAQILKGVIILIREHRLDLGRMLGGGGMPSSHSSFVCTCATSVGRMYGWGSPLFAIAAVMAIVVMYDAFNVRQAAGEQAKILNYIMQNWTEMTPELFGKRLKELLGHTFPQVVAGAILGIAIGLIGCEIAL
jgi:hypothetical protein